MVKIAICFVAAVAQTLTVLTSTARVFAWRLRASHQFSPSSLSTVEQELLSARWYHLGCPMVRMPRASNGVYSRVQKACEAAFAASHASAGKITLVTVLGSALALSVFMAFFEVNVPIASADDVQTSVTVLNTAPVWTVNAAESPASSTSTPTNVGSAVTWVGTGTDSNNDSYYLLICKTSGAPTAHESAPPDCNGGAANQWAVSSVTASGVQATAATTTREAWAESNDWFGWICDNNPGLARCNSTNTQGNGVFDSSSPFYVNHPPIFSAINNDGPANPGETVTWTSTASDSDTTGTADTIRLLVCKAADYANGSCGAGGTWATSTLVASNAATTTTIVIPTQDQTYSAFVYIVDNHGLAATSSTHGSNSSFVVSNVAPTIDASQFNVNGGSNITLTVPASTSGPFTVDFLVVDNNSCLNSSSGNEIASASINLYRSGIASTSCDVGAEYNANNCYTSASPLFPVSCTQSGSNSCSGANDTDVTWTCTYALWYVADPTDAGTQFPAQTWIASATTTDNNGAVSALTETTQAGVDLISFLAFNVTSTSNGFGALEPGQQNDPLATTTDLVAIGNVGLDEDLYGDTMCTSWTAPDSCDGNGINPANDIPVNNQKFATSSVAYASASAFTLTGSTSPASLAINVPKTTATSSPQEKDTWWGINIPSAITFAGSYVGQNTITASVSNPAFW